MNSFREKPKAFVTRREALDATYFGEVLKRRKTKTEKEWWPADDNVTQLPTGRPNRHMLQHLIFT